MPKSKYHCSEWTYPIAFNSNSEKLNCNPCQILDWPYCRLILIRLTKYAIHVTLVLCYLNTCPGNMSQHHDRMLSVSLSAGLHPRGDFFPGYSRRIYSKLPVYYQQTNFNLFSLLHLYGDDSFQFSIQTNEWVWKFWQMRNYFSRNFNKFPNLSKKLLLNRFPFYSE